MEEKKAKIIMGILIPMLILSLGGNITQYSLEDTGKNLRCSTGWDFQDVGEYAGQFKCLTATTERYVYCSDTWDTKTGKINYYCAEAVPVIVEKIVRIPIDSGSARESCGTEKCNPIIKR